MALFGEPIDPELYEDFYSYVVSAEDKDGNVIYLEIYQYSGMPSIGGPVGKGFEQFEEAAAELAKLIESTVPVDYEWSGIYEDYGVGMKYFVSDGVAGVKDSSAEAMEDLEQKLNRLFESMSAEEINEWVLEHQSLEEMLNYFEENPER